MERLTIYKNKGETFRCHFKIEGASVQETKVRLCLEFEDNQNMFFNGTLSENGECVIEIPVLQTEDKYGTLVVEAIADSIYFKVYEAEVELRNSTEVTLQKMKPSAKVELEGIAQEPLQKSSSKTITEETKPAPKPKITTRQPSVSMASKPDIKEGTIGGWERLDARPTYREQTEQTEQTERPKGKPKFSSFQDYVKKTRK
jgi:hypothetical protein